MSALVKNFQETIEVKVILWSIISEAEEILLARTALFGRDTSLVSQLFSGRNPPIFVPDKRNQSLRRDEGIRYPTANPMHSPRRSHKTHSPYNPDRNGERKIRESERVG